MSTTVYPIVHGLELAIDDSDREPRKVILRFYEGEIDLTSLVTWEQDTEEETTKSP